MQHTQQQNFNDNLTDFQYTWKGKNEHRLMQLDGSQNNLDNLSSLYDLPLLQREKNVPTWLN